MKIKQAQTKFLSWFLLCLAGIIIGIAILFFKPGTGKKMGAFLNEITLTSDSYAYAVGKAAPSVVNIYVANLNENYTLPDNSSITSSASGVIMNKNGIIVTNYHVVPSGNEPNKSIFVQTREGSVYQAFVVGCDRRTDIAVLRVNNVTLQPITVSKKDVRIGDIVLAIGNPNNLGQTVTHGIISATARSGTGLVTRDQMNIRDGIQELIQTDAPINQGNSGGALINTKGELVGINTASFSGANTYGIGFSVPVKLVSEVMDEIIRHGKVERGYLGIADDETKNLGQTNGVTIGYVDPLGPAFGILKIGDIITKVDDIPINNVKSLIYLISKSKPGYSMKFEIIRNNATKVFMITLAEDNTSVIN